MKKPTGREKVVAIIIFIASLALSLGIFFLPVQPERLAAFGYVGIFVITLLGAMTLFVPGPTMVAAFLIGATLNPLLVSLVAGFGSALGETTGYTAGYASRALVPGGTPGEPAEQPEGEAEAEPKKKSWYQHILHWMLRYPFLTLFLLSAIPNFITDVAGLIAGRIRYPYLRYLLATFLGKTIRFGMSAFLGAYFGHSLFGR